jgi:Flp pilus assembly protein TadG
MRALARDEAGSTALEFALVAPVFLMTLFLILDGGRMMFTKQALNELAVATARCAGIKAPNCTTASAAQSWAATRGFQRSMLQITSSNVTVVQSTSCNGQSNMAQATITMTYKKGALNLLPQSVAPAQLTSIACFPASS